MLGLSPVDSGTGHARNDTRAESKKGGARDFLGSLRSSSRQSQPWEEVGSYVAVFKTSITLPAAYAQALEHVEVARIGAPGTRALVPPQVPRIATSSTCAPLNRASSK